MPRCKRVSVSFLKSVPMFGSLYKLRRFSALSLVSLHTTGYTLASTLLLCTVDAGLPSIARSETISSLTPTSSTVPPVTGKLAQFPGVTPSTPVEPLEPLQPPFEQSSPQQSQPTPEFNRYRLGSGDSISVVVQNFTNLNFQATINTEGNIVLPLAGIVRIAGLTVAQAQSLIRDRLNRYVINPTVTVILAGLRPAQVTVIGEVTRPGYYSLNPNSPLLLALQTAGGSTNSADLRSVLVRRSLGNNSTIEQKVDLFTPLQNGQSLPELRLQDGDVVVVQKLGFGNDQGYDRQLIARSGLGQQRLRVHVLSYANGRIGTLTLANGSKLLDALGSLAPNPDNVKLDKIALVRFDPQKGKPVTQQLDGKRALLGDLSQNVPLQDNDVFVVGRTLIAKLEYGLSTVTRPFSNLFQFLFFLNRISR